MRQSNRNAPTVAGSDALPEPVRHFGAVVLGTTLLVLMSAFVSIPYSLEHHPGEPARADARFDHRHMS